jgi:hypothetical protein
VIDLERDNRVASFVDVANDHMVVRSSLLHLK